MKERNLKKHNFGKHYSENITAVLGNAIPVLGVKLKRGYIFELFFKVDLRSVTIRKVSTRAFH